MAHQMIFTSIERTLIGGSGYGVAAQTPNFPKILSEELPRLAGYSELYPSSSPARRLNPVNFFHVMCGQWHVLGRISHTDNDYTGRSNYLATFVALEKHELPPAGPAAMLRQLAFSEQFKGEARVLPAFALPKINDLPLGGCPTWNTATGDSGWAGHIAQRLLDRHAVNIIYGKELHGTESLGLLAELFHLIPAEDRWAITFSTHVDGFPRGNSVRLRMLQDGGAASADFRGGSDCFNITKPLPSRPEPSDLVNAARGMPSKAPANREHAGQQNLPLARAGVELVATMVPEAGPPPMARKAHADLVRLRERAEPSTPWLLYGGGLAATIAALLGGVAIGDSMVRPKYSEALAQLDQKTQDLESSKANDAKENKKLQGQIESLAKEKDKLKSEINDMNSENDKHLKTIKELNSKIDDAKKDLAAKKKLDKKNEKEEKTKNALDEKTLAAIQAFKSTDSIHPETKAIAEKFKDTQLEGIKQIFKQIEKDRNELFSEPGIKKLNDSFTLDLGEILSYPKDWTNSHVFLQKYIYKGDNRSPDESNTSLDNIIKVFKNHPKQADKVTKDCVRLISNTVGKDKEWILKKSHGPSGVVLHLDNINLLIANYEPIKDNVVFVKDLILVPSEKENALKLIQLIEYLKELKNQKESNKKEKK